MVWAGQLGLVTSYALDPRQSKSRGELCLQQWQRDSWKIRNSESVVLSLWI